MSWIALKARTDCPECGLPVMLEGPWANMICPSCRSKTAIGYYWADVIATAQSTAPGGRRFASKFIMDTSRPITTLHFAVNRGQPPICSGCDVVLEGVEQVATGTDGKIHCPACGTSHETFPAPKQARGGAQVFLGVRQSEQLAQVVTMSAKPVLFSCTNCGGNLKITTETTRIVTCQDCEVDLCLPQALWNALHPVRKRRAFWIRTR